MRPRHAMGVPAAHGAAMPDWFDCMGASRKPGIVVVALNEACVHALHLDMGLMLSLDPGCLRWHPSALGAWAARAPTAAGR